MTEMRDVRIVLAVLAALLALAPIGVTLTRAAEDTGDEKSEAGSEESARSEEPAGDRVFTNQDLRRFRRVAKAPDRPIVVDMTARPQDAAGKPEAMDPEERQRRLEAIDAEIRPIEERLKALDTRARSLHNPFLPRPQLSEQERLNEAGLDSRQILELIASEREGLEQQLADLRQEKQSLSRAPGATPSGEAAPPPPGPEPPASEEPPPEPPSS